VTPRRKTSLGKMVRAERERQDISRTKKKALLQSLKELDQHVVQEREAMRTEKKVRDHLFVSRMQAWQQDRDRKVSALKKELYGAIYP
jgi:hypothetical protein